MVNVIIDENRVFTKLAVLNTDSVQGTNFVNIAISALNGEIQVNEVDTISFTMVPVDPTDENYRKCWLFQGSDGLTYPAVANANGELLIET